MTKSHKAALAGGRYKKRGVAFEYRVRKDLENHGWFVVRSAGSLGPADLIAIKKRSRPLRAIFVQCTMGPVNPKLPETAWMVRELGVWAVLAARGLPVDGYPIIYTRVHKSGTQSPWKPGKQEYVAEG